MKIRRENENDCQAISSVVKSAFGQPDEASLINALRRSGDIVLSLVAVDAGEVVGHILFSKLQKPGGCLALAPVSVTPQRQNQAIGSSLIRHGLTQLKKEGWQAVFVLGEPEYYARFGFDIALASTFETEYPKDYFMALELQQGGLASKSGSVVYSLPFLDL